MMIMLRNPAILTLETVYHMLVRVSNISKADWPIMQRECRQYFNIASLFHTVNLSVWSMGHAVPFHTKQLVKDLGVGLNWHKLNARARVKTSGNCILCQTCFGQE